MDIPATVKSLWNTWGLPMSVILSLLIQVLLGLFAPLRRRRQEKVVKLLIWSAYLLADWIAVFTIGLLSSSSQGSNSSSEATKTKNNIQAFWCPFLLLHLGGPDTITAFAREDNELWLRHSISLLYQLISSAYILFRAVTNNNLFVPTILMLVVAIIKYSERTCAFYLASFNRLRSSFLRESRQDPVLQMEQRFHNSIDFTNYKHVVISAYIFFKFKIGGELARCAASKSRKRARELFGRRSAKEVFTVIEKELRFTYELLYTKARVVHTKIGYPLRFLCLCLVLASFLIFSLEEKRGFEKLDVILTYTLLIAALSMEVITITTLVFSNWTIATLPWNTAILIVSRVLSTFHSFMNAPKWPASMSQYSLIGSCLVRSRRPKWAKNILEYSPFLEGLLDGIQIQSHKSVSEELILFIFREMKRKTEAVAGGANGSPNPNLVFGNGYWAIAGEGCEEKLGWAMQPEFDNCLLTWHVATEICYQVTTTNDERNASLREDHRQFSKHLSDYIISLMINQPTTMAQIINIGKTRYKETYEEVMRIFQSESKSKLQQSSEACKILLSLKSSSNNNGISCLSNGCRLARELMELTDEKRWMVTSRVWVEMVCYAANTCSGSVHAQQLSKGGELLTFIWLLISHMGLSIWDHDYGD